MMDNDLIERLVREAGLTEDGAGKWSGAFRVFLANPEDLRRFAALVAEECAREADAEERTRTGAGQQHPENSASRDRCFAGARAATSVAWAIRAKFQRPA